MKRIPLTQGKFAIVDDADFEWLNQWKWHAITTARSRCYAARHGLIGDKRVYIYMHRAILAVPKGLVSDHINGDGLDNRKRNLRVATQNENCKNQMLRGSGSSTYKGVTWDTNRKKWAAQIGNNYQHYGLGRYSDEKKAALAYDKKALELFGEFACLNFPRKKVPIAN